MVNNFRQLVYKYCTSIIQLIKQSTLFCLISSIYNINKTKYFIISVALFLFPSYNFGLVVWLLFSLSCICLIKSFKRSNFLKISEKVFVIKSITVF